MSEENLVIMLRLLSSARRDDIEPSRKGDRGEIKLRDVDVRTRAMRGVSMWRVLIVGQ